MASGAEKGKKNDRRGYRARTIVDCCCRLLFWTTFFLFSVLPTPQCILSFSFLFFSFSILLLTLIIIHTLPHFLAFHSFRVLLTFFYSLPVRFHFAVSCSRRNINLIPSWSLPVLFRHSLPPLSTKSRTFFLFLFLFLFSIFPLHPLLFLRETDIVNRSFNLFL